MPREAMEAVAERAHADILSDTPLAADPVSVTMPPAEVRACRYAGELAGDEFEMAFNQCEVGSRPIGLAQC
jgi:hypothetical protein